MHINARNLPPSKAFCFIIEYPPYYFFCKNLDKFLRKKIWLVISVMIENANWLKGHGIVLWNQFLIWFRLSACHHFCDKAVLRSPLLVWKLRRGQKFWIFIQDYTADRWPVCVCVQPRWAIYDEDILESKISHRAKPKWRGTTLWYEKIPRKTLHFKITVLFKTKMT